jgi:hypothetical protein
VEQCVHISGPYLELRVSIRKEIPSIILLFRQVKQIRGPVSVFVNAYSICLLDTLITEICMKRVYLVLRVKRTTLKKLWSPSNIWNDRIVS